MKNLTVHLDDKPIYDIVYEESFDALPSMIKELGYSNRKICVVSESHVASLYLDAILHSIKDACTYTTSFVFPEGEASKNLNVVRDLYTHLIEEKFDRNDVLIALGGGVVGDLTGYAAATYLRGIEALVGGVAGDLAGFLAGTILRGVPLVQMPTTLLAQVDSSIGGKTGVDFDSYKNMVGAFHMPKLVYMNLSVLKTLSNRQFCSGMGEIIKHGLIKNANYFIWLKENEAQIAALDLPTVGEMIYESNVVKKNVVENDPTEKGERALLNFGHTLGHAIEKYMNFEFLHGECVLIGCALASIISYKKGNITQAELRDILHSMKPYHVPKLPADANFATIVSYTKNDKKAIGGKIKFILLETIGHAYIDMDVSEEDMLLALKELQERYQDEY